MWVPGASETLFPTPSRDDRRTFPVSGAWLKVVRVLNIRRFSEFTWFFDAYCYAKGPMLVNLFWFGVVFDCILACDVHGDAELIVTHTSAPCPIATYIFQVNTREGKGIPVKG